MLGYQGYKVYEQYVLPTYSIQDANTRTGKTLYTLRAKAFGRYNLLDENNKIKYFCELSDDKQSWNVWDPNNKLKDTVVCTIHGRRHKNHKNYTADKWDIVREEATGEWQKVMENLKAELPGGMSLMPLNVVQTGSVEIKKKKKKKITKTGTNSEIPIAAMCLLDYLGHRYGNTSLVSLLKRLSMMAFMGKEAFRNTAEKVVPAAAGALGAA
jgi:hypothetical protein